MYTFSDLAALISAGYVLLFVLVAGVAALLVPRWQWKVVAVLAVALAFAVPLVQDHMKEQERLERNRMIAERFMKLCKEKAGEKIVRTVEGVDGFLIMRPRKPTINLQEYLDQYWMGDPYGHSDLEAEKPEAVFLADRRPFNGSSVKISAIAGYDFIELPLAEISQTASQRYLRIEVVRRFTDSDGQEHVEYRKVSVDKPRSRYAYTWDDISTPEDRKYWTAGGRLQIVDLRTREVIAERVGYVIDVQQGSRAGGGISWLVAQQNACPPFQSSHTKAKEFVANVLKPAREKAK